jgi:hypothetical protein
MIPIPLPVPDASLLLSPPWPDWLPWVRWPVLATLVTVPLVLLVVLYRYELRLVSRWMAALLLGLRLLVVLLILGLVCLQPIVAREVRSDQPGRVLVVVDRSASMDLPDPQRAPADKLRLMRALKRLPGDLPSALVDQWIADLEQRREPTWMLPSESANEALREQRRKAFQGAMQEADTVTRTEAARGLLGTPGQDLLASISNRHAVELWSCDRGVRTFGPDRLEDLFGPAADPSYTDLTTALAAAGRYERGEVIGVVLLSDGQHNSGPSPGKVARELGERGVPIFPIALGDPASPPDAAILQVRGPSGNFYKGVEGNIEVRVKIAGLPAGEYAVELREEGNEAEIAPPQWIAHEGKDQVVDLRFAVTMDQVGTRTLTARIQPPEGVQEAILTNNQLSTSVRVADDRVKVLLVDGTARWEYHYLATMLQRDRLMELQTIVFDQPRLEEALTPQQTKQLGLPAQQWPREEDALAEMGCIVLGDVDAERLTLEQRQRLERYVGEAGGTLVIIAGKKAMPLGFAATLPNGEPDPLTKLLPIEQPRLLAPVEGFALTRTRAGADTRFMELDPDADDTATLWAGHPRPWTWAVAGVPKPGATALASWLDPAEAKKPITERERSHAVIVRHNYGFGRVLFMGIDSTWRWRFRVGDLYHHRFWGQVLRWAAADKPLAVGNEWLRFGTPQPVYAPGEVVDLTVRLAEKLGPVPANLLAGARVIALPRGGNEAERPVALVPLSRPTARPRVLEAGLRDLPPGEYAVELAIPELGEKTTDAEGKPLRTTFRIAPPESKEMLRLETNVDLLMDLAHSSNGRLFAPHEVGELRELLTNRNRAEIERIPTKLYQGWWMLAVVVSLLSIEWILRKTAGLP